MRQFGKSRLSELAPIHAIIENNKKALIDLFGGTGFASDYLGHKFGRVVLVDQVQGVLPPPTTSREVVRSNALLTDCIDKKQNEFDVAICLAGFHHVLPFKNSEGFDFDINQTRTLAMKSWGNLLVQGGKMIVADVPIFGSKITEVDFSSTEKEFLNVNSNIESVFENMNSSDSDGFIKTEPYQFLEFFVKQQSPFGHDGFFESESSLRGFLVAEGFEKVKTIVKYTPWVFPDFRSAAWFFNELFAIGDISYESPSLLPLDQIKKIGDAINKYLGSEILPDGTCIVHWKLLYAWGQKNGE
jgi:hypothetical protein